METISYGNDWRMNAVPCISISNNISPIALQTESKSSNWSYMYTTSSSYDTSVNTSTVVIATAGAVNQDAALSAHAKEGN